jgi:hypothetical protein
MSSTLVFAGPERMDSIPGGERGMEVDLEDLEDWHCVSEFGREGTRRRRRI